MSSPSLLRQLSSNHVTWAALAVMLLSSLLHLPRLLEPELAPALRLARLWHDPAAQLEAAIDTPHQLFWAAAARLPIDAEVLLITAAWDPDLDDALLQRARYALAPRPVRALATVATGAPRHSPTEQLAFELRAIDQARQLGCSHLLSIDPAPRFSSSIAVRLVGGTLVPLAGELRIVGPSGSPRPPRPLWPFFLLAALAIPLLLGNATLRLLQASAGGLRHWATAWPLGCAELSWAMLLLSRGGMSLDLQVPLFALATAALTLLSYRDSATQREIHQLGSATAAANGAGGWPRRALIGGLALVTLLHLALVALLALGRPWLSMESWAQWGVVGRSIFRLGRLGDGAVEFGNALGLPLAEAWISGWLGQADERLLGVLPLLSWVGLLVLVAATVAEHRGSQPLIWMTVATLASLSHLWTLAGRVVVDPMLSTLAAISALAALRWRRRRRAGDLALSALSLGLLPTLADAGIALAAALALALFGTADRNTRSPRNLAVLGLWVGIAAGPGWLLRLTEASRSGLGEQLSGSPTTVLVAAVQLLISPGSAVIWLIVLQVLIWRLWRRRGRCHADLLLIAAAAYLILSLAAYLWHPPAADRTSQILWRHGTHVLPLALLWLVLPGANSDR